MIVQHGEPLLPNVLQRSQAPALRNAHVLWERLVGEAFHILSKLLAHGFWPSGIVPQIPDVGQVTRTVWVEILLADDVEHEDIPSKQRQAAIVDVNAEVLAIGAAPNSSGERIPQISTAQEEKLWISREKHGHNHYS